MYNIVSKIYSIETIYVLIHNTFFSVKASEFVKKPFFSDLCTASSGVQNGPFILDPCIAESGVLLSISVFLGSLIYCIFMDGAF
jgi:hypothetical protein